MSRQSALNLSSRADYVSWQGHESKNLKRLHALVPDVTHDRFDEISEPAALKHILGGAWS